MDFDSWFVFNDAFTTEREGKEREREKKREVEFQEKKKKKKKRRKKRTRIKPRSVRHKELTSLRGQIKRKRGMRSRGMRLRRKVHRVPKVC